MRIFKDSQELIIDNEDFGAVNFEVIVSWYLFPQVFILNKDLHNLPSVDNQGFCYPSVTNDLQIAWIKCLFNYKRYKRKVLMPYFANLRYLQLTGNFANGSYSKGITGIKEYASQN